jgi:hypothetical protein
MGSAARRRGAYGGEYLRAEFRVRARGGRRLDKKLVKLGQKGATGDNRQRPAIDQKSTPKQRHCQTFIGDFAWNRN